ncbi:MAG: glutathione peroxidase [Alphaproteobacteria bacterium]|nr:glutathione peroxidase [Alphaproteobacteria bacterium]
MFLFTFIVASQCAEASMEDKTAYDFTFQKLRENAPLPLSDFEGKVLLIVNTASQCGFTPQYDGLEKLYNTYKDRGLVVIGVPSNDFGGQEPGTSDEIAHFCKINYGVTFPMTKKEVVSGAHAHPFYIWAKQTLGFGTAPKWNFHKYLIDRHGKLIDYFNSTTSPESDRVKKAIEKALAEK